MTYYELYQQGPAEFIPVLLISICIMLLAYGTFPIAFAKTRNKPITRNKYVLICFAFNCIIMFGFIVAGDSSASYPCGFWTVLFAYMIGPKILKKRGVLATTSTNTATKNHTPKHPTPEHINISLDNEASQEQKTNGTKLSDLAIEKDCTPNYSPTMPHTNSTTATEEVVSRKKNIRSYVAIAVIAILLALNIYQFTQVQNLTTKLDNRNETISQQSTELLLHKKEAQAYKRKYEEIKDKADFMDNNIVFVIDGDDTHYYTYNEMMLLEDYEFTYWAYNIENAVYLGYEPLSFSGYYNLLKNQQ